MVALFFPFGVFVAVFGAFGASCVDDHFAPHEWLVVEDFDGSFCFLKVGHIDEPVSLGFVSVTVVDELDFANCADSFEEFFEVML